MTRDHSPAMLPKLVFYFSWVLISSGVFSSSGRNRDGTGGSRCRSIITQSATKVMSHATGSMPGLVHDLVLIDLSGRLSPYRLGASRPMEVAGQHCLPTL
jgi:hypothetical protein